jgi:hypothetical protein
LQSSSFLRVSVPNAISGKGGMQGGGLVSPPLPLYGPIRIGDGGGGSSVFTSFAHPQYSPNTIKLLYVSTLCTHIMAACQQYGAHQHSPLWVASSVQSSMDGLAYFPD